MPTIYQKIVGDNTLVLDARQAFVRQIDTGSQIEWTDLRIGMYCAGVDTGSDNNTGGFNENVGSQNNPINRLVFGLKDGGPDFPGSGSAVFVGMMTSGSTNTSKLTYQYNPYYPYIGSDTSKMFNIGYNAGTKVGESNGSFTFGSPILTNVAGTSTYHAAWGVRFLVNNRGLSTQTISLYGMSQGDSPPDYTSANLRSWLGSQSQTSLGTIAWNNGATAYAIPNNFFVYMPFNGIKLRISALGGWVFSS